MSVGTIWNPGMMSSLRTDWRTPRRLFEMLNREFHFSLDLCATPDNTLAPHWIEPDEDSLSKEWWSLSNGEAWWCNPPYGRGLGDWIEKAYRTSRTADSPTIVMLLPARTDTKWFHNYCLKGEIRFLRGRLHFDDGGGRAPFPSMIVVFRPSAQEKPTLKGAER